MITFGPFPMRTSIFVSKVSRFFQHRFGAIGERYTPRRLAQFLLENATDSGPARRGIHAEEISRQPLGARAERESLTATIGSISIRREVSHAPQSWSSQPSRTIIRC